MEGSYYGLGHVMQASRFRLLESALKRAVYRVHKPGHAGLAIAFAYSGRRQQFIAKHAAMIAGAEAKT